MQDIVNDRKRMALWYGMFERSDPPGSGEIDETVEWEVWVGSGAEDSKIMSF